MRLLLLLIVVVFLAACGTVSSVKSQVEIPLSTSFIFVDQRPAEQKISRTLSELQEELLLGDDAISPSSAAILKAAFEKRAGGSLRGMTVTLLEIVVSVRESAVSIDSRRLGIAAASVPGGVVAAPLAGVMILGIEKSRQPKSVYVKVRGLVGDKEFLAYQNDRYTGRVTEGNILATLSTVIEMAARDADQLARTK